MFVDVPDLGIGDYVSVDVGHILQGGGVGRPPLWLGDVGGYPPCSQDNGGFPAQGLPMADGKATSEAT